MDIQSRSTPGLMTSENSSVVANVVLSNYDHNDDDVVSVVICEIVSVFVFAIIGLILLRVRNDVLTILRDSTEQCVHENLSAQHCVSIHDSIA